MPKILFVRQLSGFKCYFILGGWFGYTFGCYGLSSFVFVILFAMLCSFWSAVYRVAFSFWVAAM